MSAKAPAPPPLLVHRGGVNTWECDEGGHLNVRFHFERNFAGLARLAAALDAPRVFAADATATLAPMELHARFLKEARPRDALSTYGGVLALNDMDASFLFDTRHLDGAPATAMTIRAAHVEPRVQKPFPWPARVRAAASAAKCEAPDHAKPRSIDMARPPAEIGLARAIELGARHIGASMVQPDMCDAFGRLRAEHVFGRVSDAISSLLGEWRRALSEAPGAQSFTPAGAVVETRIVFRRWPKAGDFIDLYSGVTEINDKTLRVVHWLIDPITGAGWASIEAVTLTFDVKTRKAVAYPPEAQAAIAARIVKDFAV